MTSREQPRVVIVGGGCGGVAAARALRHCDAEVILIDRRNHHIFQPLLYQVATATLAPSDIAAPIRDLVRKQKNLVVMLGEVESIDVEAKRVVVASEDSEAKVMEFDYLVVAPGVQSSYFGHDEFAKHAPSLKTIADAELIRTKVLRSFERAEMTTDMAARSRFMRFVLVQGQRA